MAGRRLRRAPGPGVGRQRAKEVPWQLHASTLAQVPMPRAERLQQVSSPWRRPAPVLATWPPVWAAAQCQTGLRTPPETPPSPAPQTPWCVCPMRLRRCSRIAGPRRLRTREGCRRECGGRRQDPGGGQEHAAGLHVAGEDRHNRRPVLVLFTVAMLVLESTGGHTVGPRACAADGVRRPVEVNRNVRQRHLVARGAHSRDVRIPGPGRCSAHLDHLPGHSSRDVHGRLRAQRCQCLQYLGV
jgi:hypothetical protein